MLRNSIIDKTDRTKIMLAIVFIVLVFLPLVRMFVNIDIKSLQSVTSTPVFNIAIYNSVLTAFVSTIITIISAYLIAMCIERTNIKHKEFFVMLFVLPMLVPSISNGMGLIILFGNNGFFTKILGLSSGVYGFWGIVFGSILYAFPVAYLMFSDVLKYEDASPYEAAKVLGIPPLKQFIIISYPYLRKPLITIFFSIFTLIITDYGVPLMVGGKYTTVPVVMYQEVIGQLNFAKGSVYGAILLVPAAIAFVIDLLNKDRGNSTYVTKTYVPSGDKIKNFFAYLGCSICGIYMLLPVVSFILLALCSDYPNDLSVTQTNLIKTFELNASKYLCNSIVIAVSVSALGTFIAFLTAYLSARMKSKVSKFLHLASMTSAAIPGIVLGLAYVLLFKGSYIYGTIFILVMVNLIHFISSPYLMIYNSMSKINENIEAVAETLGIGRFNLVKDVFLSMCKTTLYEMFVYLFVNCMITISAVSFLSNTGNKPISLMINQFEAQMQLENAAVVSLVILFVNLVVKGVFAIFKRKNLVRGGLGC